MTKCLSLLVYEQRTRVRVAGRMPETPPFRHLTEVPCSKNDHSIYSVYLLLDGSYIAAAELGLFKNQTFSDLKGNFLSDFGTKLPCQLETAYHFLKEGDDLFLEGPKKSASEAKDSHFGGEELLNVALIKNLRYVEFNRYQENLNDKKDAVCTELLNMILEEVCKWAHRQEIFSNKREVLVSVSRSLTKRLPLNAWFWRDNYAHFRMRKAPSFRAFSVREEWSFRDFSLMGFFEFNAIVDYFSGLKKRTPFESKPRHLYQSANIDFEEGDIRGVWIAHTYYPLSAFINHVNFACQAHDTLTGFAMCEWPLFYFLVHLGLDKRLLGHFPDFRTIDLDSGSSFKI